MKIIIAVIMLLWTCTIVCESKSDKNFCYLIKNYTSVFDTLETLATQYHKNLNDFHRQAKGIENMLAILAKVLYDQQQLKCWLDSQQIYQAFLINFEKKFFNHTRLAYSYVFDIRSQIFYVSLGINTTENRILERFEKYIELLQSFPQKPLGKLDSQKFSFHNIYYNQSQAKNLKACNGFIQDYLIDYHRLLNNLVDKFEETLEKNAKAVQDLKMIFKGLNFETKFQGINNSEVLFSRNLFKNVEKMFNFRIDEEVRHENILHNLESVMINRGLFDGSKCNRVQLYLQNVFNFAQTIKVEKSQMFTFQIEAILSFQDKIFHNKLIEIEQKVSDYQKLIEKFMNREDIRLGLHMINYIFLNFTPNQIMCLENVVNLTELLQIIYELGEQKEELTILADISKLTHELMKTGGTKELEVCTNIEKGNHLTLFCAGALAILFLLAYTFVAYLIILHFFEARFEVNQPIVTCQHAENDSAQLETLV